jgi:hypothetical protein
MSIFEVKELLGNYIELNLAAEKERVENIIEKFMSSGSYEMKQNFLSSFTVGVYVTDVSKAAAELKPSHVKKLSDPELCLLLIELLNDRKFLKMLSLKDVKLKVYINKYVKKEYEVRNYFNNLLVSFSNVKAGITVDQKLIDECLSVEESKKKYVKGVQLSVTTTLTGKMIDNSFRPHPEANKKIVLISELGKCLDIGKKSRTLKCPTCGVQKIITSANLTEILGFEGKTFVYQCTHIESETYIGEECFKKDLDSYLQKKYSAREKSMFVLNNFTRLTDDTL